MCVVNKSEIITRLREDKKIHSSWGTHAHPRMDELDIHKLFPNSPPVFTLIEPA